MSADWPTAAAWLASGSDNDDALVVAGIPLHEGSVTPSRYDLAPSAIRERLGRLSTFAADHDVDLADVPVRDHGDSDRPPALDAPLTVLLGGHNGVTYEALHSRPDLPRWGLLTLDAHHDVRAYDGAPGNGSPVRALVDAGLPAEHIVQVGIHGFCNAPAHRRWCEARGIRVLGPAEIGLVPLVLAELAARCDAVYVDIDMDVLDRAYAPACPGSRPGGVRPAELFAAAFAAGAHPAVRAVDIVEVDPTRDVASVTVDASALTLLTVAAGYGDRRRKSAGPGGITGSGRELDS
ncbi:MAG: arginase family protein [Actinobacteria bacterium]|nr:arginase family protein [Actinomycetota bacterium]